jgi:hypothetical protein
MPRAHRSVWAAVRTNCRLCSSRFVMNFFVRTVIDESLMLTPLSTTSRGWAPSFLQTQGTRPRPSCGVPQLGEQLSFLQMISFCHQLRLWKCE